MGGSGSQDTSECQFSPATCLEFSSAWMTRISMTLHEAGRGGMHGEVPEEPAEGLLRFGRQALVPEEDDRVLDEGVVHLLEGRLVQRPRQVDAVHLGADVGVSFSILISDWGMRASFSCPILPRRASLRQDDGEVPGLG